MKASYRGDNRAFIASDIDPHAWGLHKAQQKEKKQELGALRHLRAELLNTLAPSAEALAACTVRTHAEEETTLYSSDEETQLLSDQEHCPRAAALANGVGKALKGHLEGILEDLSNPVKFVAGYVELLFSLPEIPGLLASYIEEVLFEEDEEKQAEMVGELLTHAVLLVARPKKALQKALQLKNIQSSLGKKLLEELRKQGQGVAKGIHLLEQISKRAPEILKGKLKESQFLKCAEKYLGEGYKEVSKGRFVSKDGLRQVRYGKHEVTSKIHHAHFEIYDKAGGRIIENARVLIEP